MVDPGLSISVIIPTYNRAELLKRALKSIQQQKLSPLECLIIDDGSTDNTEQVVREFSGLTSKPFFRYLKTHNLGVSHARNLGLKQARGSWIAFLDSDDEWLPEKLSKQVEYLTAHPDCEIVHGNELWIRNGEHLNQKKYHTKSGGHIYQHCLPRCCISPSAVLIRNNVFSKIGAFNEAFPVCEDYDLWLRMSSRYSVGFVPTPIIRKYGGHPDQLSKKFFAMDYWRIKAMHNILRSQTLSKEDQAATAQEIRRKAKLLMKGYIKHNNMNNFSEVESILNSLSAYPNRH